MKNFAGLALSLGLATGVANAQNNPAPKPFADEHGTPPPSIVDFGGENGNIGVFNSSQYGPGISARVVFQNGKCGLVLDGEFAQHDRDTLAAVGCDIVEGDDRKTTILFGGAWRETDLSRALSDPLIPENTDGKGKQVFLTVVHSGEKRRFEFTARGGEADNETLYTETRLLGTENVTVREGGYMVTRSTATLQDYLTIAYGDKWANAEVRATFVVNDNSEIVIALGAEKEWSGKDRENISTKAIGDIQWRTSFDTGSLVLGANRYGNQNGFGATWEAPLWNGKVGYRLSLGRIGDDTRAGVSLVIPLGGNAYTAPRYGKSLAERNLSNALLEVADNNGNHVADLGERYAVVTEAVGPVRRDLKETGRTMVPNASFNIGSTTCTLTSFTAGNTTICTLNPTDPDGIASVTATVDNNPVVVSFDGISYSVSLVGLGVGTHTLTWTGTGNKPDGTPEPTSQSVSQEIVVTSANNAPVPTFTGMTFDASLSANVSGQLTATDADAEDNLTYALVTPPSSGNMIVNANGSFTITGAVMPGTYTFTYSVTDGQSAPVSKVAILTVNDVEPTCTQSNSVLSLDDDGASTGTRIINKISCTGLLGRQETYNLEVISYTGQQPYTGPLTLNVDNDGNVTIEPFDINGPVSVVYKVTVTPQGGTKSTSVTATVNLVDTI